MKIMLTGGTGFVGTRLTARLVREGHEVTVLTRSVGARKAPFPAVAYLQGDPLREGPWQDAVRDHDALINLAGASIFSYWTEQKKKEIRESRIATTRNLVAAIAPGSGRTPTLLSTSAVGYYGYHGDEELTEGSPPGNDFLAQVAVDWEAEALKAAQRGARVAITRFGIVLGEKGGALGQMLPLFKLFLGGPIGSGKQWFSWIHIADLAEAFVFLLQRPDIAGPVNVCTPHPVRNSELAKALGRVLHRPSFLPAPGFMVRLILGEFGSVILKGQRALPRRLVEGGFAFRYPRIDEALENIAM